MNKPITYSFIIPHKNTPKLLQRCLGSIPQRDDIEIIVVDNNSSHEIVDFGNFPGKNRRDVLIINDNISIGAGGARNTGLTQARGKWLLFADADDYYSEGFLNVLDRYVNQDIDVLYFNFNRIKDNQVIALPYTLSFLADNDKVSDNLKYRLTVPWNKMVKKELLDHYHVLFEDCVVANDLLYTYQVGYYSNRINVETSKIYNYVINKNSVSTNRKHNKDYYYCCFRHYFQNNEFYKFVGHPEWQRSFLLRFVAILKKNGFSQLCNAIAVYAKYHKAIKESRFYFVEHITKKRVSVLV